MNSRHTTCFSCIPREIFHFLALAGVLLAARVLSAQVVAPDPVEGRRWAVIIVGLPGDEEHADLFNQTADVWQKWLVESLGHSPERVLRFPESAIASDKPALPLTANVLRSAMDDLRQKLQPNDSLWVFTLGHGHYDGKRAWFHVGGRDPSDEDFGRWMSGVKCREQVLWLTHSSSGWFVKPLSRPGRIVIAATAADDESNETEFPHALADVTRMSHDKLDVDADQQVSVAELFTAILRAVHDRFQSDKRLPTEHAQLDDNGDGKGSEKIEPPPSVDDAVPQNVARMRSDGDLASQTLVPFVRKSDAIAN